MPNVDAQFVLDLIAGEFDRIQNILGTPAARQAEISLHYIAAEIGGAAGMRRQPVPPLPAPTQVEQAHGICHPARTEEPPTGRQFRIVGEQERWIPEEPQLVYRRTIREVTEEVFASPGRIRCFSNGQGLLQRVPQGWVFLDGQQNQLFDYGSWMPVTTHQARSMGYTVAPEATWVLVERT